MRSVTLLDLRTSAKFHADMQNSNFILDPEWNFYINQGMTEYENILNALVEDYNIKELYFTLPSNSISFALPADFFDIRGLDINVNLNATPNDLNWRSCRKYEFKERNRNNLYSLYWNGNFIEYRVQGNTLHFIPGNHSTLYCRLFYTPVLPKLVLDTDTIDGVNGFDEYIALYAAIRAKDKEETDSSPLMMKQESYRRMILTYADSRNNDQGKTVSDVNNIGFYGY